MSVQRLHFPTEEIGPDLRAKTHHAARVCARLVLASSLASW